MINFKLSIYTPNAIVIKDLECESLRIPTTSGEINVLPGHTHLLTVVDSGVLEAKISGDVKRHFLMTTGVCKVLGSNITITSPTAERAEDIDVERAKAAQAKAQSRLSASESLTNEDRIKFIRKLERAKNRIRIANLR
jgi:F-type H+-transporting ATPase subunit epsilon